MTPTEIETYCRNLHNAVSDNNWTAAEIYALITAASNEVLSVIGLAETTDTSLVTVAGTQSYTIPSAIVSIHAVEWDGRPLRVFTRKEFQSRQPTGVAPEGDPREAWIWGSSLYLSPTPSSAATITLFAEQKQTLITAGSDTIVVPEVFHIPAIADYVIGEMFMKDKDLQSAMYYQNKWRNDHKPSMQVYARKRRRGSSPIHVQDADSSLGTETGMI